MSLFSFGVGGDVWSSAGFAFVSPINDILDKETFTLEEILAQDEVLQEAKSLNIKLVEFLSRKSSMREMMAYLAEAPPNGATDNRVFKFPYMSCEIICCEVAEILNAVANDADPEPLRKLFSMLDQEDEIDAHRAGYLEKILTVLLKHRCGPTTSFVNAGGLDLFRKMVRHLGNFSIMQVAKLLLLPKYAALQDIDATGLMAERRGMDGSEGGVSALTWCTWSDDPGILETLLGEFRGVGSKGFDEADAKGPQGDEDERRAEEDDGERSDVHMHLSELLLALIAQCSPESQFLKRMFSKEAIDPLIAAATLTKEQGRQATGSQAALQILAALGDRLVRPLPPSTSPLVNGSDIHEMQVDFDPERGEGLEGRHKEFLKVDGGVLERGLRELVPSLCAYLRGHTEDPAMITAQTKQQQPRMGSLRLQVVRFLETLVGMDNPVLDQVLIQENAMATCLEMMFTYETASMLHTSVAASVLAILIPPSLPATSSGTASSASGALVASAVGQAQQGIEECQKTEREEGGGTEDAGEGGTNAKSSGHREAFQRHLFEDCRLVERILEAVALNEDAEKVQSGARVKREEEASQADAATAVAASVTSGTGGMAGETSTAETSVPGAAPSAGDQMIREEEEGEEEQKQGSENTLKGVDREEVSGSVVTEEVDTERTRRRPGRRLGHMGHVLLLSKAVVDAENLESGEASGGSVSSGGGQAGVGGASASIGGVGEHQGAAAAVGGRGVGRRASRKSLVGALVSSRECVEQWHEFVSTTLVDELGKQLNPLGGYAVPSRDNENQLSDFPDETVDMDDTTGLLETITRLQTSAGNSGNLSGAASANNSNSAVGTNTNVTNTSSGTGAGAMNESGDLEDAQIDAFESADLSGNNNNSNSSSSLSMMFMSNAGSAWGAGPSAAGSGAGVGNVSGGMFGGGDASVSEAWANFADFGDAQVQQQQTVAAGTSAISSPGGGKSSSRGSGSLSFANFDSVFSMDATPAAGSGGSMTGLGVIDPGSAPNEFAPSPPPNWAPRPNSSDAAAATGSVKVGGGAEAGGGEIVTPGGVGGGSFATFPQMETFADFSAMMDDAVPSSSDASLVAGAGGDADDRMDDDTEEEGDGNNETLLGTGTGAGVLAQDASAGLGLPSSARDDNRDSVDAMVGSDDDEKDGELGESGEGGQGGGDIARENP